MNSEDNERLLRFVLRVFDDESADLMNPDDLDTLTAAIFIAEQLTPKPQGTRRKVWEADEFLRPGNPALELAAEHAAGDRTSTNARDAIAQELRCSARTASSLLSELAPFAEALVRERARVAARDAQHDRAAASLLLQDLAELLRPKD